MPSVNALQSIYQGLVWRYQEESLPVWKAVLLRTFRVGFATSRDLAEGQLTLRAMSLVYTTLLSLVPLIAISFSVLKGFGLHNQVEPMLLNLLSPLGESSLEITQQIMGFVANVKVAVLGFIGFGFLFYTVISLMQKIEHSMNYIWRVSHLRTFSQRVRDYFIIVLVGPLLVFIALGISTVAAKNEFVLSLMAIQPFGWLLEVAATTVPFLMIVGAFTFIYMYMPNTGVRLRSAFVGALVAGALWHMAGWAFASFVASSSNYTAIYSTFATLIVFLIWLYLGWLILLTGVSIAFYDQNPTAVGGAHKPLQMSNRVKEKVGLMAMVLIGRQYQSGTQPQSLKQLTRLLAVPGEAAGQSIDALESTGLLLRTADEPARYIPAHPLENISVSDILDAIRSTGEARTLSLEGLPVNGVVERVSAAIDTARREALRGQSLRDLVLDDDVTVEIPQKQTRASKERVE